MRLVLSAMFIFAMQLFLLLPAEAAGARINAFDRVFGPVHCSARGVCIVTENSGGVITDFQNAAKAVNHSGLQVVIAGPCYSACTIFADLARKHVCITSDAEFGFHQASVDGHADWNNPLPGNSPDVVRWVNDHGGYPTPDRLLLMQYADARQFWKTCTVTKG